MKVYQNPTDSVKKELVQRPSLDHSALKELINQIFDRINSKGDEALHEYTKRFDDVNLKSFELEPKDIDLASETVPTTLKEAIKTAAKNIETFHRSQQSSKIVVETATGVTCWQEPRAIESIGIYIPGGSAPLFSTALMLAIPARIAGCKEVILCSPPDKNGQLHPAIVYAAQLCGVHRIFKIGGAQSIAAMTYGTESVPKVSKIFGPGNQYVTAAKQKAFELGTAIDMPAGPSELLVFSDATGNPSFIASDLLSQAEHGPDSQVLLVSTNKDLAEKTIGEVREQLDRLPRKDIAVKALENSHVAIFDEHLEAFDFINQYAPEHLIIQSEMPDQYLELIHNAGSVFVGNYTPESAGDYASGTNHTLPTNGHAKAFSGVNMDAYVKKITFQKITKSGLQSLGDTIIHMAEAEQLQAHANAVKIRVNE